MRESWARYLEQTRTSGQKEDTWKRRVHWSKVFLEYFETRSIDFKGLTRKHLDDCQQWLHWTNSPSGKLYTPNTIHQALRMLRQFLRWAAQHNLLDSSVLKGWSFGRCVSREPLVLNRAQLESILQAPGSHPVGLRDQALIQLFAELGHSSQRCRKLNVRDFDLANSQLDGHPISAILAERLHRYLRHSRPALLCDPNETALFLSLQGRRPTAETLDAALFRRYPSLRISPRSLHRSWLAQRAAFLHRRLPGI